MCLEMDSRKWKILGFFIRHTEGGGSEARGEAGDEVSGGALHAVCFFRALESEK